MSREFTAGFYQSKAWRKCRAGYIAERRAIDGGLCERCRQVPGYIVHHKVWLTPQNINNPDISLCHDNLEYVCLDCHNRIENESRYCLFDDVGNTIGVELDNEDAD